MTEAGRLRSDPGCRSRSSTSALSVGGARPRVNATLESGRAARVRPSGESRHPWGGQACRTCHSTRRLGTVARHAPMRCTTCQRRPGGGSIGRLCTVALGVRALHPEATWERRLSKSTAAESIGQASGRAPRASTRRLLYFPASYIAAVAQLARASACHAEGRGFESLQPLVTKPCTRRVFLRVNGANTAAA